MTCYISSLPNHILIIIFWKLPITSLRQCKYVCKLWNHILENHYLGNVPLSLAKPTEHFLCLKNKSLCWLEFQGKSLHFDLAAKVKWRPFQWMWSAPQFIFLNSCNGLLCVCQDLDIMHIINPITSEYISLPLCQEGWNFYPSLCGLGFDPNSEEFKVLGVCRNHSGSMFQANVCTLGSGTWRSIHMPPIGEYFSFDYFHAFVNGSLHCLVNWRFVGKTICAFDFQGENFREVPLPAFMGRPLSDDHCTNVGVFEDRLYLCSFDYWTPDDAVDVWVMKEYGVAQSWTKILTMRNKMFFKHFSGVIDIHLLRNGDVLIYRSPRNDLNFIMDGSPDMFLYDPRSKRMKKLKAQGIHSRVRPINHQPSFVSLKQIVGDSLKVFNANGEDFKLKMKVLNVREDNTWRKKTRIYWKRLSVSAIAAVGLAVLIGVLPVFALIMKDIGSENKYSVWEILVIGFAFSLWFLNLFVFVRRFLKVHCNYPYRVLVW